MIDTILSRLDGYRVRKSGRDRWRACCPAHGGSNPSALSVGIGADDAVLLKCWHGCDTQAVLHALGLDWADILPDRPLPDGTHAVPKPRRVGLMTTAQAIDLIQRETGVIWVVLVDLMAGRDITDTDLARAIDAADRVEHICAGYAS